MGKRVLQWWLIAIKILQIFRNLLPLIYQAFVKIFCSLILALWLALPAFLIPLVRFSIFYSFLSKI